MKRTKEDLERAQAQLAADREAAERLLASPAGEALIRYLTALWKRKGLGETPERTAYRVAFRDAVEQLEAIRAEGAR